MIIENKMSKTSSRGEILCSTVDVRWEIIKDTQSLEFLGKDIIAVTNGIHILFLNLISQAEVIYNAKDDISGDGVEVFTGHRTAHIFAFAEKSNASRLFILTYPDFRVISIINDKEIKKYISLGLIEAEQILALSDFPNFLITIWCWRTNRRLVSCETGVRCSRHIFRCSMSQNIFCHASDNKIAVWEIVLSYKMCYLLCRKVHSEIPVISDIAWTLEGLLYFIDMEANLYLVSSDGIGTVYSKEWSSNKTGSVTPSLVFYKNGFIIYGPDLNIMHIKKVNKEWVEDWSYSPKSAIDKISSGGFGESLIFITVDGCVVKLSYENHTATAVNISFWSRFVNYFGIIYPTGHSIITTDSNSVMCLWNSSNGELKSIIQFHDVINYLRCSPVSSIIAICIGNERKYGVALLSAEEKLSYLCSKCLTDQKLDKLLWSDDGNKLIAITMAVGHVFIIELGCSASLEFIYFIDIKHSMMDCRFMACDENPYLICLVLYKDGDTFRKHLTSYNLCTSDDHNISGYDLDQSISKFVVFENTIFAISSLLESIHILQVKLDNELLTMSSMNVTEGNHIFRGISIAKGISGLLSWGLDGKIIYRDFSNITKIKYKIDAAHRFGECIKYAMIDPSERYIVSVTRSGNLSVHNLTSNSAASLSENGAKPKCSAMQSEIEKAVVKQLFNESDETWMDTMRIEAEKRVTLDWAVEHDRLAEEYEDFQKNLTQLIENNITAPPPHKLPMITFNLDTQAQEKIIKDATEECKNTQIEMEERIKAQDNVCQWIKQKCWDPTNIKGKELHALYSKQFVENYALFLRNDDQQKQVSIIEKLRRIETQREQNIFLPWIKTSRPTSNVTLFDPELPRLKNVSFPGENSEMSDEFLCRLRGSTAHLFVPLPPFFYSQLQVHTNLQMQWQTAITEDVTYKLQLWFNKQFDEMMTLKEKEVALVEDKNKRLKEIISELNILNELRCSKEVIKIIVKEPKWAREEIPKRIVEVQDDEVSISIYVSPSQIQTDTSNLNLKDDFREQALMDMMDGTLQKLWHEEIKKPIEPPPCMVELEPEDFDEEDLKEIYEWQKKVEFRNDEREQYRKLLRTEYVKLSSSLNEGIIKFNQKVNDIYVLKLKVESAIGQEHLRIMRLRLINFNRIAANEIINQLELEVTDKQSEQEQVLKEINEIQGQLNECHAAYEALTTRDRTLDKNFKSNFSDVSPIVLDLCHKLFKKRPKIQLLRATMTVGVLGEMAQACLTKERPPLLHHDCMDYLKALDQLDSIHNIPPVMDESIWSSVCKLRRVKVDNEIKIQAVSVEIAEVEAASIIWQKRNLALKTAMQRMRQDITQKHANLESQMRNISIQFIIRSGLVEIETNGHEDDFKNAILIRQHEVESINLEILKAGSLKLKAMRTASSFKKHILSMEWEHAKLKMKIRHLEQDLYHFERIKVTKEVQAYLKDTAKKHSEYQDNLIVEQQLEATKLSFNKQLYERMKSGEELEMKIGSVESQIKIIDDFIDHLKLKISEKQQKSNPSDYIERKKILSKRMETLVWRNRLVSDVQKQHTAIILLQTELELQRLRTYPTLSVLQAFH